MGLQLALVVVFILVVVFLAIGFAVGPLDRMTAFAVVCLAIGFVLLIFATSGAHLPGAAVLALI